jgi:DNA mismatch endonuclease (patch repair protein)
MDAMSPEARSRLMAQVRSRDTAPELRVRRLAHSLGLRFRLHDRTLPGRPDLVLRRHRAVIFVHGCFWHRHKCSRATTPKSNPPYWTTKFAGNVQRDRRNAAALRRLGWRVLTVWECQTESEEKLRSRLTRFFGLPA